MTSAVPSMVALIPARAGSKRVRDKNVRVLGAHPAIAYSIAAARASGVYAAVVVSTDAEAYADVARHYGAEAPFLRPASMAADLSPDIEWIEHALGELAASGRRFDAFSILRPTSPLRTADTIRRAFRLFSGAAGVDSLRAVERCKQHPAKMWVVRHGRMHPLLPFGPAAPPWHSTPYQALPEVFVQNASLEMAWTRVISETHTIAGETIAPFVTEGYEGFDVNDPENWWLLERLIATGAAQLPEIAEAPYVAP